MPTNAERIASGLETHRIELDAMADALKNVTMDNQRKREVVEHMARARHAIGLARVVLLGDRW